ncbi:hypothetical protein EMIT051CA3_70201 [Pseudomonas chlororaphis]
MVDRIYVRRNMKLNSFDHGDIPIQLSAITSLLNRQGTFDAHLEVTIERMGLLSRRTSIRKPACTAGTIK